MPLSCCLFDQSKAMQRHQGAQLEKRKREGTKERKGRQKQRGHGDLPPEAWRFR